jgi:hypothetical protein
MKKLALLLLGMCSFSVLAQSGGQSLTYRMNDPFLFCTKGQDVRLPCWRPVKPYTGAFMPMLYCNPPNWWGKSWTSDDWASLAQYVSICPQAINSGGWKGKGSGEYSPFKH